MAALVRVSLIQLGPVVMAKFAPLNVPVFIKPEEVSLTVSGAAIDTNDAPNTLVGIDEWCWRFTVRSGHVMVHNDGVASASNGMFFSATEGERVGVLACIPGMPLSFFEVV